MKKPKFVWHLSGDWCALVGDVLYVRPESGLWGRYQEKRDQYNRLGFKLVNCPLKELKRVHPPTYEEFMAMLITGGTSAGTD